MAARFIRFVAGTLGLFWSMATATAQIDLELEVAPVFTDHVVLQRDQPIRVFGTAVPGAWIQVRFAATRANTTVADDGTWSVTLPPQPSEHRERPLVVEASADASAEAGQKESFGAVCGDVWLCAGQSNMRWPVNRTVDAGAIKARANRSDLRLLDYRVAAPMGALPHSPALLRRLTPDSLYEAAKWQPSTIATAARFSAVAHAFGRRLVGELGVPIGLIDLSVGGAPMEAFVPEQNALPPDIKASCKRWLRDSNYPNWCQGRAKVHLKHWWSPRRRNIPPHPFAPHALFRAGIQPLAGFGIRGILWYQGESNATGSTMNVPASVERNAALHRAVIAGFRSAWQDPKLPFYFVQLPGIDRAWAPFRQVQLDIARTVPGTGMVVSIDLGHPTDVHPREKTPIGERLARLALARIYGVPMLPTGPLYREHSMVDGQCRVVFDHARGLMTTDGRPPTGFELAGTDRRFHPARAHIDTSGTEPVVVLTAAEVGSPATVRYAYSNDPRTNLINAAGIPAAPFRAKSPSVR